MAHSRVEIYIHYVWATHKKEPLITQEFERSIYRCIQEQCEKLNCPVLALGGIEDHLHLAIKLNVNLPGVESDAYGKGNVFRLRT